MRIFGQYGKNGLILLFPAFLTGGLLMLAGDRMDGLKIGFLSLLGVVLMLRYGATRCKWWLILSVLWWLMFVLHSAVLSASWLMYDSSMDAYFVVRAIANTTPHESLEFVQSQMGAVLLGVLALVVVGWAYVWLWRRGRCVRFVRLRRPCIGRSTIKPFKNSVYKNKNTAFGNKIG